MSVAALPNIKPVESTTRDFFLLLKPRVMSLVVFTAIVGAYMAPGSIHPFELFVAILCIALGAGASGVINMWYDRDIDAAMERTAGRPLVQGRVDPSSALAFGVFLSFFSVILLGLTTNLYAAFLLAFTIAFYVFIYTMWLKRSTPQNIVIGGAAGALPPVIGWAAVSNSIDLEPLIYFSIIFFWTPPHFWALSLNRIEDYTNARVPMLPVVSGVEKTKIQIFLYSLILVAVSVLPYLYGSSGLVYLGVSVILGMFFIFFALRVWQVGEKNDFTRLFWYSILYLSMIFLTLILDRWIERSIGNV
jgi:protoheme IX farnesyltransferase